MGTQAVLRDDERYELLGEVASGGMATVYLARMRRPMGFSRLVAIKCMHPQFAKDPSFVSMFTDEARLTARLRHPNIVPTLDIVHEDGQLLLVMEYVEGESLARLLHDVSKAGERVPAPIACAIAHDLLLGLHEAHQAKDDDGAPLAIVHRDVSPQNVLVGLDGLSRVLDFGVAKARQNTHRTNDSEIKGKVPYMPPEQLFGEPLDHRADVYAAGVTLWEALVCERLFDGPSETAVVHQISQAPVDAPSRRRPDLPPELDAIVMKALARDPSDRYESALTMAEAIAAVVSLPTRTELSAWMRRYVTPREVPSGSKLVAATPASTMLAALEKASVVRPSSRRPAPAPRATGARTTRYAIGVAAFAFAVAGVAVARAAKSEARPQPVTTTAATVIAARAPEPTPRAPRAIGEETPAPKPPERARPSARAGGRVAAATPRRPAPKPRAAPEAPAAETKSSCAIPFTIDARGFKHFKAECVH